MMASKKPAFEPRRQSSTLHYQTFPTKPPTSRGHPPSPASLSRRGGSGSYDGSSSSGHHVQQESPLPKRQLIMLAVIALAEQTALNSISPYLPDMTSSFPGVKESEVGLYVGLIASGFALAQFTTNFFWGWLSDRIGRKPVILTGTVLTAACFVAFGFCRTFWQAIVVQIAMGLVNGNQGVISTCLGEITDRSNQSRAFTYLPVIYGIGGITGPAVGGLLVFKENPFKKGEPNPFPYLIANLFSAVVLAIDFVLACFFLQESLEEAKELPPLRHRIKSLFAWMWQFTGSSYRPTYLRRRKSHTDQRTDGAPDESPSLLVQNVVSLKGKDVFTRDTILILVTFLIFQLSNVAYNALFPIFGEAKPPTGRGLSTEEIGLSLAFSGVLTIFFQIGIYGRIRDAIGNKNTYRLSLGLFVVSFLLMPWVGYKDKSGFGQGKIWLWIEMGGILIIKAVAAVGGLTSALLLITNSAPNHSVLGTLNGLAQTLSAAGRAVGPFMSGGLFSASTKFKHKGEALAFGLFAIISLIGLLLSFGIRSPALEADGDEGSEDEEDADGEEEEDNDDTPLLSRG
ncbi:MFS general substrate transporter [Trichodelitschia bisporula]|uniref:MFS general substrate transporter n=1 Tax=Trichodelitschia bisporula TaxID=703511 RepID=A0A6G1I860_9PEZI|nr:MFS general substrate transporter [Trichodelitschia bisporula]